MVTDPGRSAKPTARRRANDSDDTAVPARRSGRRRGDSGTRRAIEQAALSHFAARGFAGATVRAIAADAGVDPALIMHFFGSKQGLFRAVLSPPDTVLEQVVEVTEGPRQALSEGLAALMVTTLNDPELSGRFEALLRTAASDPAAAAALREQITDRLMRPVAEALPAADADLRANLVGATMGGLVLARQILAIDPLASVDPQTLTRILAAGLQAYLTSEAGLPETPPARR